MRAHITRNLALTSLETLVFLIDDVDTATAFDHAAVAVTAFQCFQRVSNFHNVHQVRLDI